MNLGTNDPIASCLAPSSRMPHAFLYGHQSLSSTYVEVHTQQGICRVMSVTTNQERWRCAQTTTDAYANHCHQDTSQSRKKDPVDEPQRFGSRFLDSRRQHGFAHSYTSSTQELSFLANLLRANRTNRRSRRVRRNASHAVLTWSCEDEPQCHGLPIRYGRGCDCGCIR